MPQSPVRSLKCWNDSMSDGCSVPQILRLAVPKEDPAQCRVCAHHDQAYYYGGSRALRREADATLRRALIATGMWPVKAWIYWLAVRTGGVPYYRVEGVSWAFGGNYFKYSAEPAQPAQD